MELSDVFKFGKYKDQTLESVLGTERGRSWCAWWVSQPAQNPKFEEMDKATKSKVRRHLTGESKRDPISAPSKEVHTIVDIYTEMCNMNKKLDVLLAVIKPPTTGTTSGEKEEDWEEEEQA